MTKKTTKTVRTQLDPNKKTTKTAQRAPNATFTAVSYARQLNIDPKRARAKIRSMRDTFEALRVKDASTLWTFREHARAQFDAVFANMIANAKQRA